MFFLKPFHRRGTTASLSVVLLVVSYLLLVSSWPQADQFLIRHTSAEATTNAVQKTKSAPDNQLSEAYGKVPIGFEPNHGQMNSRVKFFGRGHGYGVFLTANEAVVALAKHVDINGGKQPRVGVLRLGFLDSNRKAEAATSEPLPGTTNYFRGRQRDWTSGGRMYGRVRYHNIYDGVDVVYYGNSRQLEYDFVVSAGADPSRIKLTFKGGKDLRLNPDGDLMVATQAGDFVLHAPVAYQVVNSVKQTVESRFLIHRNEVSFHLGAYDAGRELIIDPILSYSTYLGGSGHSEANDEVARAVAVDGFGNAYLVGSTVSTDFPVLNAYKPTGGGFSDAFICKFNPSGTALIYSTYLGGSGTDEGLAIAVDASGSAYVTGVSGAGFPTTPGAFQTTGLDTNVFVAKLSPAGNSLVYSTLLNGDRTVLPNGGGTLSSAETGYAIAVNSQGEAYVAGETQSSNFPVANALQNTRQGGFDAFVARFNASGSGLIFSTYLGGTELDRAKGIALDGSGNIYVAGETFSENFPTTAGALKTTTGFTGLQIGFVTKFLANGSLGYSTYLGDLFDLPQAIAVNGAGEAFVTGGTQSQGFPVTGNAVKPTPARGVLFKSLDASANWRATSLTTASAVNAVAFDPTNSLRIYAGTQAGLFRSVDGGNTWILVGLSSSSVLSVFVDPSNPNTIFAGTNGQGIFKSIDNGVNWINPVTSGSIFTFAGHPQISSKFYAGTNTGGLQSSDSGANWTAFGSGGAIRSIAFVPGTPDTIYLGTATGVVKTVDGGSNWTTVFPFANPFFVAVAVDPSNTSTVYAAHRNFGVYKTTDAGQQWNQMNTGLLSTQLLSFVLDGTTSPATLYAGTNGSGVFKSVNGGVSWSSTGLSYSSVNSLAIDRQSPATIFAGTTNFDTDAFLSQLNSSGSALIYSTRLGGSGFEIGSGIALDPNGDPVIVGRTASLDLPLVDSLVPALGGTNDAFVLKLNMAANTIGFSSYLGGSGVDYAAGVAVDSVGGIYVVGNTRSSNFPTQTALQPTLNNVGDAFITKFGGSQSSPTIQLSSSQYTVGEGSDFLSITVTRTGDVSAPATVKYTTNDATDVNFQCNPNTAGQITGAASRKCDYHIASGRLRFAAGETSKQIILSVVNDVYVEPSESLTIALSSPTGAALGTTSTATITITDNDTPGQANPIDGTPFYVRMLYVDLLSREPEPAGLAGWIHRIDFCGHPGEPPPPCDRVTVGGDGFLRSEEFFDREFFVIRLYRTALGRIPRYDDVGDLAYVSGFLTSAELELNKQELVSEIMSRPEFGNTYNALSNAQFVDTLIQTAAVTLPAGVREGWVSALDGATKTRAQVFRELSERAEVSAKYLREAQVVSCYYGFFTRNPDGAYFNYLQRLDSGEITLGDLANAFINAAEYRQRFGP